MTRALLASLLVVGALATPSPRAATSVPWSHAQPVPAAADDDLSIAAFLLAVEAALLAEDRERWLTLVSSGADRAAAGTFFDALGLRGVTKAVIRERDRVALSGVLPGDGFQLLVDAFFESGSRGRIVTWQLDIRKPREASEAPLSPTSQPWRLTAYETLSSIEGLHRLALDSTRQYTVKDLRVRSVDLELQLPSGVVFVVDTADGVTGLVLIGDGTMSFSPAPAEERGQLRIFAGADRVDTPFANAFIRLSPFEFALQLKGQLGDSATPEPRAERRAQAVFAEEAGKSFSLDLRDLSRDSWSLLPQPGDFLAEVDTRRFGTLTFARSLSEAEDVTVFHRQRQRNIASYASEMKLSSRGRFYNEDDLVEYDVRHHALDLSFAPEREWIEGRSRMTLRIKAHALAAITLRLADELTVSSITSTTFGRLMFLRVRHQNNVVINLPVPLSRGAELTLDVAYAGPIRSQSIDQETVFTDAQSGARTGSQARGEEQMYIPVERNWLFSNKSHWYPQNQVTDYATASVRFSLPAEYKAVVSGLESVDSPVVTQLTSTGVAARVTYVYEAPQPVRYLGAVISRFHRVDRATVALDTPGPRSGVTLAVDANRRQQARGREVVDTAADILRLYASLVGEAPYDSMTVAMVEDERPGGHSPAYVAMLNNPLPLTPWLPRQDPAAFQNFPEFYIAHEIAHQWWGQAVGWKNYHEQWLSEGFAQYFAALYARERRGPEVFDEVIRHLRRWAMDQSDQGAVYLGYRLGHLKGDSRVFRALVYNKGAMVLHMLRRALGDETFYKGLRGYYQENRFRKAGTEDLQRAMETASGRSLDRFFERWIFSSGLPSVRYTARVDGASLVVRFEQMGDIYDVPVTLTFAGATGPTQEIVLLDEAVVERRFALPTSGKGDPLRAVQVNADYAALGTFERYGK